jgi:hypothetical protein
MSNTPAPINGNYIDSDGQLHNLDGGVGSEPCEANRFMAPFSGQFIGSDGLVHNLSEALGGSSSGYHTIQTTLAAGGWADNQQTILDNSITASGMGIVLLSHAINAGQVGAWLAGQIVVTGQADGSMTFQAFGLVPTVDVPIAILLL